MARRYSGRTTRSRGRGRASGYSGRARRSSSRGSGMRRRASSGRTSTVRLVIESAPPRTSPAALVEGAQRKPAKAAF